VAEKYSFKENLSMEYSLHNSFYDSEYSFLSANHSGEHLWDVSIQNISDRNFGVCIIGIE
jgi:hypothetical protein